jgi:hypothetical protein
VTRDQTRADKQAERDLRRADRQASRPR